MTDDDKPDSDSRYWRYQAVRVDYKGQRVGAQTFAGTSGNR
jgi:hypothetical protein